MLPTEQMIELKGHVDLFHEERSRTIWSQIPELDILKVGTMLSPQGIYMVSRDNTKN